MKNQTAYRYLADWFEYLNDDCDYENWSQYLISLLKDYPVYKGLDIGCGGGWFTRAFIKSGYDMSGVDKSAEMLSKAEESSLSCGVRARYFLGDIASFTTHEKFDFATAINDCVNYLPKNKLLSAFKNVYRLLLQNGIFLFDISSERKFREKIANTVSVDDREEVTYLSFNSLCGDEAVLDVSLFVKGADGKYERKDERHVQYVYTAEEIEGALNRSGFTLVKSGGHLGEEREKSDRIWFLAKKGEKHG